MAIFGLLAAAALAPAASAATAIGEVDNRGWTCVGDGFTMLQKKTEAAPAYAVPAGGGVITSWSHDANDEVNAQMALKVFRPTAVENEYLTVGKSRVEVLTPSTVNTFTTRIPVREGDLIGLSVVEGEYTACNFPKTFANGDVTARVNSIPEVDSTASFLCCDSRYRVNVAASVEADADRDGYGDETQDMCPTDRALQEPCTLDPAPRISIDEAPRRFTSSSEATFSVSSDDPEADLYCKLASEARYRDCASAQTFTDLSEGQHTFRALAVDAAGNRRAVSYTWTVDRIAPVVTIEGGPDGGIYFESSAQFTFSANEQGVRFICFVDTTRLAACSSPQQVHNLADGRHRFVVYARDRAGNLSEAARRSWRVDTG